MMNTVAPAQVGSILSAAKSFVGGAEYPDSVDLPGMEGGAPTKAKKKKSRGKDGKGPSSFHIISVTGPNGPLKVTPLSQFSGACPSAAAAKAGRRVYKAKNATKFTILMRRVDASVFKRTLHKYAVQVKTLADPVGVFTAKVHSFTGTDGKTLSNVSKRVRIAKKSTDPVFGYIGSDGVIKKTGTGQPVHRDPSKNTLVLVIGSEKMPTDVSGNKVQITKVEVVAKKAPLTASDVTHDTSGKAKVSA